MKRIALLSFGSVTAVLLMVFLLAPAKGSNKRDQKLFEKAKVVFKPLPKEIPSPKDNPTTPEKVELGKMLYYDPRLSRSGFISCNSCHNLATFGVDNQETSIGHRWQLGPRNAPTVLNAAFHIAQFWDGRAADLEEQAKGPIINPVEMAMPDSTHAVEVIKSIPQYVEMFKKVFGGNDPVTYDNIAKAIAAFERTLITRSRFDRFLEGDLSALSEEEKEGLKLFMDKGCSACHNGVGVGGHMYAKFGIIKPYPSKDLGRYEVTKKNSDKHVFKVASLRNVAVTYPYFHDGKVWKLEEAVRIMAELQLGTKLSNDEVRKIVAFLNALTGEIPKEARELPVLPPSSENTPKPQR
ncbi:MAG: cytochrome-c peroxidase [Thermotogae bacterium]|nr:cytochrome-c peroxidase [Thermotogota bacterium]